MELVITRTTKTHNVTVIKDAENVNSEGKTLYKIIAVGYEDGSSTTIQHRAKLDIQVSGLVNEAFPTEGGDNLTVFKA